MIKKFGLALANLEKATVRLNALKFNNIFGSSDEISDDFKAHYL